MSTSAEVSAGNPCPFLRAAVAGGYLDGHVDQLAAVSQLVVDAGAVPAGEARRVRPGNLFHRPDRQRAAIRSGWFATGVAG